MLYGILLLNDRILGNNLFRHHLRLFFLDFLLFLLLYSRFFLFLLLHFLLFQLRFILLLCWWLLFLNFFLNDFLLNWKLCDIISHLRFFDLLLLFLWFLLFGLFFRCFKFFLWGFWLLFDFRWFWLLWKVLYCLIEVERPASCAQILSYFLSSLVEYSFDVIDDLVSVFAGFMPFESRQQPSGVGYVSSLLSIAKDVTSVTWIIIFVCVRLHFRPKGVDKGLESFLKSR